MLEQNTVLKPQKSDRKFLFSEYLLKIKGGKRTSPLPAMPVFDVFIS